MPSQSSKPALTLVEVVVALALLSTLLVATLVGFSKQADQFAWSRLRLEAIELSDQLLYDWTNSPEGIPVPAHGSFDGRDDLLWQTEVVDRSYAAQLGLEIVRFEVRHAQAPEGRPPLVEVELFVEIRFQPVASAGTPAP